MHSFGQMGVDRWSIYICVFSAPFFKWNQSLFLNSYNWINSLFWHPFLHWLLGADTRWHPNNYWFIPAIRFTLAMGRSSNVVWCRKAAGVVGLLGGGSGFVFLCDHCPSWLMWTYIAAWCDWWWIIYIGGLFFFTLCLFTIDPILLYWGGGRIWACGLVWFGKGGCMLR